MSMQNLALVIGELKALSVQNTKAPYIINLAERKTKLIILVLLDGPTSGATKEGIRQLAPNKKHVLTLTSDNGKEFSGHAKINKKFRLCIFARPITVGGAA